MYAYYVCDGLNLFYFRYGLLGASGCGKTTLLRCMLGRLSIQSGHITILGKSSGPNIPGNNVGYMPQVIIIISECPMLVITRDLWNMLLNFSIMFSGNSFLIPYYSQSYFINLLQLLPEIQLILEMQQYNYDIIIESFLIIGILCIMIHRHVAASFNGWQSNYWTCG